MTCILSVLQKKLKYSRASRENFDTNAAFRLLTIRKERLILTLPAQAMYCTYVGNSGARSSVTQKREPYRDVMWRKGRNWRPGKPRERWKDNIKVDKDTEKEGMEWIHMDHEADQLWAVMKTVMNIWRNNCKRKDFLHSLTDCHGFTAAWSKLGICSRREEWVYETAIFRVRDHTGWEVFLSLYLGGGSGRGGPL